MTYKVTFKVDGPNGTSDNIKDLVTYCLLLIFKDPDGPIDLTVEEDK